MVSNRYQEYNKKSSKERCEKRKITIFQRKTEHVNEES
jgi:hypothetical protein